jgi:uncharacterized membrane protein YgcG
LKDARKTFARRHAAALSAGATALVLGLLATALAPHRPLEPLPAAPASWFNDSASLVSPAFASGKNVYLPIQQRAQVVVVIEPRAPTVIEEYTVARANAWRVGAGPVDNGIAMFVFPDVRAVRVDIGYGLEGVLPDVEVKHLLDDTLLPRFAKASYEDGFDEFFSALFERLQNAAPGDAPIAAPQVGFWAYVGAVVRQFPRYGRILWTAFLAEDWKGRLGLTLFAAVGVVVFGYLLQGVLIGVYAILMLPWRIAHGTAWRALDRRTLAQEFAPAQFVKRPPPSLVAAANELGLPAIAWGIGTFIGTAIVIAFLASSTPIFVGARGHFSGAGVTTHWPAP